MARRVRDANLESREARTKLKGRDKPYWRAIERGLHLGYRKPKGGGTGKWAVRHYLGKQSYEVETIAAADDKSDADGVAILNFWQAQELARKGMVKRAHKAAGKGGSFTVADAMAAYLEFLEANRKSAADARYRVDAHILPTLGGTEVGSLTTDQLRRWLADLAKAPARLRTRKGKAQQHRPAAQDDEERRRRRSTANRTLTVFKAALNHAWHDGHTPSDAAWRRVKPFEGADAAKVRYLAVTEATRLINSSAPVQFRNLVQGALQTGARYGELARLVVSDFNPDSDTVAIRQSKGGKPRHVVLTDEGAAFFAPAMRGPRRARLDVSNGRGRALEKVASKSTDG